MTRFPSTETAGIHDDLPRTDVQFVLKVTIFQRDESPALTPAYEGHEEKHDPLHINL
jgi:hypothetical protein